MLHLVPKTRARKGFTLVELAVVIVIIGVLAAFGVPRFLKSVERSKSSEAFAYLTAVRSAQERYVSRQGTYTQDVNALDIQTQSPKYFNTGGINAGSTGNIQNSWSMTLTRQGSSAGYGAYTVNFTDQGYQQGSSSISSDITPMQN
jgi:prepilin-type N-terminal cleavage/methylation domain-containing protein